MASDAQEVELCMNSASVWALKKVELVAAAMAAMSLLRSHRDTIKGQAGHRVESQGYGRGCRQSNWQPGVGALLRACQRRARRRRCR